MQSICLGGEIFMLSMICPDGEIIMQNIRVYPCLFDLESGYELE